MNTETDTIAPEKPDGQIEETIERPQKQIARDRRRDKEQVARAVACSAAVARLYRRYGGVVTFVEMPATGSVKTGTPVNAPKRGYAVKRTIKGLR